MRILLTGMNGSGKSKLTAELVERGYRAIDLDDPEWSEFRLLGEDGLASGVPPMRDWVWREERVAALLRTAQEETLFLSGTASNQRRFHRQFDFVVLLTAPAAVTTARLVNRTTNSFGRHPDERATILENKATFEPVMQASADLTIDTDEPMETTIERLLNLVAFGADGGDRRHVTIEAAASAGPRTSPATPGTASTGPLDAPAGDAR